MSPPSTTSPANDRRAAGNIGDTSVEAAGGRRYAVGDRVVALAPDPERRFVTSQRGTVTTIDPRTRSISVTFDDTDVPGRAAR